MTEKPATVVVCTLYHFVTLDDHERMREPLLRLMREAGVKGTLLLAAEGINGTIAGSREGVDLVLAWLRADLRLAALDCKESYDDEIPFLRSKVKLKKEIVTMGVEGVDPNRKAGTYVDPEDWNALISDPEVTLVDTRNEYEVEVGTFRNAVNPGTQSFREFPAFVDTHLDPARHKKVAMFCTGGIRCEKSTAYLKQRGFEEVYHLKGGILNYLARVPEDRSLWQGECFVFDSRVAVDHGLEKGGWDQCHACRLPITEADKRSEKFEPGVSCPRCHDRKTEARRAGFRERWRQRQLARARGEAHLGEAAARTIGRRRSRKSAFKEKQRKLNPDLT